MRHLVLLAMFYALNTFSKGEIPTKREPPPGHKHPLGGHMKPLGVTVIGKFSTPVVFYGHFVKTSRPLHLKSVLFDARHPGSEWTDEYLRAHYGKEMVRVELGKKEVRSRKPDWMRLSHFLDSYHNDDLYLVHSLSGVMLDLVKVPWTLSCGGFEGLLQEAVMWMGKGPLRSVLHYDELDNLLCIIDGVKDVILIDQIYKKKVESKGFEQNGYYSLVDVESVDMFKFSQFRELPWYRVHLAAGDCLYIPYKWYHQVSSFGNRTLAVSLWFSHLWWFNDDDQCEEDPAVLLKPLQKFGFASPNEAVRSRWLESFKGGDDMQLDDFLAHLSFGSVDVRKQLFSFIDHDGDELVSWEELYSFNIDRAILLYPDIFSFNLSASSSSSSNSTDASWSEVTPSGVAKTADTIVKEDPGSLQESDSSILSNDSIGNTINDKDKDNNGKGITDSKESAVDEHAGKKRRHIEL